MSMLRNVKQYLLNQLLILDQIGNTVVGGDPQETISSHIGRIKVLNGGKIPWSRPVSKILDPILNLFQPNHSIKSLEVEQGSDGLYDRQELTDSQVHEAQNKYNN